MLLEAATVPSCCSCFGLGLEEGELSCPANTAGADEGRTARLLGGSAGRSLVECTVPVLNTPLPAREFWDDADTPSARRRS